MYKSFLEGFLIEKNIVGSGCRESHNEPSCFSNDKNRWLYR